MIAPVIDMDAARQMAARGEFPVFRPWEDSDDVRTFDGPVESDGGLHAVNGVWHTYAGGFRVPRGTRIPLRSGKTGTVIGSVDRINGCMAVYYRDENGREWESSYVAGPSWLMTRPIGVERFAARIADGND